MKATTNSHAKKSRKERENAKHKETDRGKAAKKSSKIQKLRLRAMRNRKKTRKILVVWMKPNILQAEKND